MLGAIYPGQAYPAGFPGVVFEAPPPDREGLPLFDFDSPAWGRTHATAAWSRSIATVAWARASSSAAGVRTFITPAWARTWRGED